ncbi:uncharacterized protein LOC133191460 [Saccostrea echinata]|uniref:uncharacterized protein LOC133191460 n=1 Tax=Saccostrea echinata TaxID=191078 RepID=UPI002A81EEF1|nr:uncharacterized protein LOC133191460 [Saccostrea echinata]
MDLLAYDWGLWKNLVREISCNQNDQDASCLNTAVQWYENETMSKYGCQPQWSEFLMCLQQEEPIIQDRELKWYPVFHHLSYGLQSVFLQLLLHFRHKIPTSELVNFTKVIASYVHGETWVDAYIRMLVAHCQLFNTDISDDCKQVKGYVFTSDNEKMANSVLQQLTSGRGHVAHSSQLSQQGKEESSIHLDPTLHDVYASPSDDCKNKSTTKSVELTDLIEDNDTEEPTVKKAKVSKEEALEPNKILESLDAATQADLMKLREHWQNEYKDFPEEFKLFYTSTPNQVGEYCRFMDLDSLSENSVASACQNLLIVSESISHDNSVQFLQSALLPKLSAGASRPILGLLKAIGEKLPNSLVDGIFMHLVLSEKSSSSHYDVMCKIMKDSMPVPVLVHFIKKLNSTLEDITEAQFPVYQMLFDLKIPLGKKDISLILEILRKSAPAFPKNLKFGKLVLATLNVYGKLMEREHVTTVQQILQFHTSFLKKSIESAINKLGTN